MNIRRSIQPQTKSRYLHVQVATSITVTLTYYKGVEVILIASVKTLSTAGTRKRNQMQWSYDSAYLEEEGIPVNTHQIKLSEVGLMNSTNPCVTDKTM